MKIELSKEKKQQMIESIKLYFEENMDEKIGDLKASLLLEYFLQEIGPSVYNKAIADSQAYMQDKVSDLDGACYMPELEYWKKLSK